MTPRRAESKANQPKKKGGKKFEDDFAWELVRFHDQMDHAETSDAVDTLLGIVRKVYESRS